MPTAPQDTEITLGTGRMLAIFFSFVLVCAFFFAIGFSLGRKTTMAGAGSLLNAPSMTPATVVRPSAVKNPNSQSAPQSPSNDFSFYKAVGEKKADSAHTPQDAAANAKTQPPGTTAVPDAPVNAALDGAPASAAYYVQVAAVTRQEDADALVEALKKKQYPAFTASNPSVDKFYRVQIGPYADFKDADAMRARLIGDGYRPIVKK